jgi:hypothetical protein
LLVQTTEIVLCRSMVLIRFPLVYVVPQEGKDKHRANNDFIFVVEWHRRTLLSQSHLVEKSIGTTTSDDLVLKLLHEL